MKKSLNNEKSITKVKQCLQIEMYSCNHYSSDIKQTRNIITPLDKYKRKRVSYE